MSTTIDVTTTVRPEVRRGAAFLDEHMPGWDELIDLTSLDLNQCWDCVLGQALGYYDDGCEKLGLEAYSEESQELGFTLLGRGAGDEEWASLTEEWRDLIAARR